METKSYNGWTNYETWNVALWFNNDSNEYWPERAEALWNDAEATANFTREERATFALADQMKGQVEEGTPTVTGLYADLLNASLSEVNWLEIASHFIDNVDKEEEDAA